MLIIQYSKAIIKHSSQRHLIVWMVEDCPFGNGMCWQIDEQLTLYAFDPKKHRGGTWTLAEWTIYKRPFNTHSLQLLYWPYHHSWRSESSRWMNIVAPKQARHPLKVPDETPLRTTHITMNYKENDWSSHPSACTCMHMHGYACIFTLMHADGWNASRGSSVGMHMHTSAYRCTSCGCTCMHMHAE